MPIPVTDLISTTSPVDTYATHDASMGRGGHRTVATYNDMLAITAERRVGGMQVHVLETDKLYKLSASTKPWRTIAENVEIAGSTTLDSVPDKTAGMLVFAADNDTIYKLEDDLITWTAQPKTIPSYYITNVANNAARDALIQSDRFIGMLVFSNTENKYYRLQGFSFDNQGRFVNSALDWVEVDLNNTIFVVDDLIQLVQIPADQLWAGRKAFVINEQLYVELSRANNEWEEIPINEVPYYIVETQAELVKVPPFYRKPGLLVFVKDETKLYTRNNDNNAWVAVTSDSIAGDSAYDVAVNNGFVGTEAQWLASLRGTDGQDGAAGRGIVRAQMSPLSGELEIEYTDGTIANIGVIKGDKGDDGINGISIVNIELFDDPNQPGTVYFITELSDGRVLQTRDAINGYNGLGIADMTITNNMIEVMLDDGSFLQPIPISGLKAIDVVDVRIENGDLMIEYSNGIVRSAGAAANLAGRGVLDAKVEDGIFKIKWTDDPDTFMNVGNVNSVVAMNVVDGELMVTYANSPTPVKLTDLVGITGAYLNPDMELVFTTTRNAPNNEINIGPVQNIKGDQGESLLSVALVNNDLIFTLTDGTVMTPIPVSGLTPISVSSARIENGDLFFGLTNGTEIAAGLVDDLQGRGIAQTEIDGGKLYVYYDDDPSVRLLVGDVPGIDTVTLTGGELFVTLTNDPDTQIKVGDIKSLDTAIVENGILKYTYTNGTTEDIATLRSIDSMAVSSTGDLSVTYTDNTIPVLLGNITGPRGPQGFGFQTAYVDSGGNLIINTDNPANASFSAGFVRTTIQNLIGQTPIFTATAGQTDFTVDHDGQNAIVFVNGVMLPTSGYSLATAGVVALVNPLQAGDEVRILSYAPGGPSATGRGVFSIADNQGVYTMTLEDGSTFTIDTNTPIDVTTLPPGIVTIDVLPNGDIEVVLSDNRRFIAGSANNAINITGASVDPSGDLIITTTDVDNPINAGSVLSGLQINGAQVNQDGELIFTTSTGTTFNAGPAANYVTNATINSDGQLLLDMSLGNQINAGDVRNPLLGMIDDVVAFQGQVDFPIESNGYEVLVYANGVALSKDQVDTSDPAKITLLEPRDSGDIIKFLRLYKAEVVASGLAGEAGAPNGSYYGKDKDGNLGFHPATSIKMARPFDFVALDGQVDFFVNHNENVEVIKNNVYLMANEYSFPNLGRVRLTVPCQNGDRVRIVVLSAPVGTDGLQFDNYAHVRFQTNTGGGAAVRGAWRTRNLNDIKVSNLPGVVVDRGSVILPPGTYYVKGWAAANAVGSHAIRLYDVGGRRVLMEGEAVFSGIYPNNDLYQSTTAPQLPNSHAPIEGYMTLTMQTAVQIQHRVLASRLVNSGFGAVGAGFAALSPATGTTTPANSNVLQEGLGQPATLVDFKIWKVG